MKVVEIYRIYTQNSIYEIKVAKKNGKTVSACKRLGHDDKYLPVKAEGTDYLEMLYIGASFRVPGVVLTSRVQDYDHFKPSRVAKRVYKEGETYKDGINAFFDHVTDHVVEQVSPKAQRVS